VARPAAKKAAGTGRKTGTSAGRKKPASPSSTATGGGPKPPASATTGLPRVRIRMYRQGVGDAFLLTFATGAGPAHILIDCGLLLGSPDSKQWMQRVASNVAAETQGQVNAIVGTHPHWDHLSGFIDAREIFQKQLKTDEVWLSWAENPRDPAARAGKEKRALQLAAIDRALAQLAAADSSELRERADAIAQLLAFHGPLGASGGRSTEAALDVLRKLVTTPAYLEPGALIAPKWLPGVRVYVLGPPRDQKLLGKMLGKVGSEMYGLGADAGFYAALLARAAGDDREAKAAEARSRPFDATLLWPARAAAKNPALADVARRYVARDEQWRKIDEAWLLSAEELALQLDNVINNLSMVLAFELVDSGEVLLFAADAQVGNWLSWQSLAFKVKGADGEKVVRSRDLLAQTVFYKVGHHGSHNATLKDGGLEAMTHPGLVAAIPVNQAFANDTKRWEMPAPVLYPALVEKTEKRIIRSDGKGPAAGDPRRPSTDKGFLARVSVDPVKDSLYVDYRLD
jgi:hypothetical protein